MNPAEVDHSYDGDEAESSDSDSDGSDSDGGEADDEQSAVAAAAAAAAPEAAAAAAAPAAAAAVPAARSAASGRSQSGLLTGASFVKMLVNAPSVDGMHLLLHLAREGRVELDNTADGSLTMQVWELVLAHTPAEIVQSTCDEYYGCRLPQWLVDIKRRAMWPGAAQTIFNKLAPFKLDWEECEPLWNEHHYPDAAGRSVILVAAHNGELEWVQVLATAFPKMREHLTEFRRGLFDELLDKEHPPHTPGAHNADRDPRPAQFADTMDSVADLVRRSPLTVGHPQHTDVLRHLLTDTVCAEVWHPVAALQRPPAQAVVLSHNHSLRGGVQGADRCSCEKMLGELGLGCVVAPAEHLDESDEEAAAVPDSPGSAQRRADAEVAAAEDEEKQLAARQLPDGPIAFRCIWCDKHFDLRSPHYLCVHSTAEGHAKSEAQAKAMGLVAPSRPCAARSCIQCHHSDAVHQRISAAEKEEAELTNTFFVEGKLSVMHRAALLHNERIAGVIHPQQSQHNVVTHAMIAVHCTEQRAALLKKSREIEHQDAEDIADMVRKAHTARHSVTVQ